MLGFAEETEQCQLSFDLRGALLEQFAGVESPSTVGVFATKLLQQLVAILEVTLSLRLQINYSFPLSFFENNKIKSRAVFMWT